MAEEPVVKPTKYVVKGTTNFEVDIDIDDVLGFISECNSNEKELIKDEVNDEPVGYMMEFEHLSTEVRDLLEVCGKTLDEDEKLIYFLTNIEDISLEQLKEATSGQQV